MSKKILLLVVCLFSFSFFTKVVEAAETYIKFNEETEEIEYSIDAWWVEIRKAWIECTGTKSITIVVYNGGTASTEYISGRKNTNQFPNGNYTCQMYFTEEDGDENSEDSTSFTKKNYDPNAVDSSPSTTNECNVFKSKKKCNAIASCKWNGSSCEKNFVASKPCNEDSIKQVLRFFGYLLLIAKVAIPLIIIGFGTIDLFKSVIDKDDSSLGKQTKRLIMRVVAGFIVFFIPNLVHGLFKMSDSLNVMDTEDYEMCATCLLDPTNCTTSED